MKRAIEAKPKTYIVIKDITVTSKAAGQSHFRKKRTFKKGEVIQGFIIGNPKVDSAALVISENGHTYHIGLGRAGVVRPHKPTTTVAEISRSGLSLKHFLFIFLVILALLGLRSLILKKSNAV